MQKRSLITCKLIFIMPIIFILGSGLFSAAKAAPYFEGKAITIIVPKSPGGGTDMVARAVGRHLGKYIPGDPAIVIRNIPASRGLVGTNLGWNSKPNGKTLLNVSATEFGYNIFRNPAVEYRLHEMIPVFASPTGNTYYAKPGLVKEPKDIMNAKGLIFGAGEPNDVFVWAKELIGFKTEKMIWGYSGAESRQAFLQGEINVGRESTIGYNGVIKSYVEKGEAMPLFQTGILDDDGNIVREPAGPDAPTVAELYEQIYSKKPSGPYFEAYKLLAGGYTYAKCILLPKNVSADIVAIFRNSIAKMVKDPKFMKEMDSMNPGAPELHGKNFANFAKNVVGDTEVVQFMKKFLAEEYNMVFK